MELIYIFVIFDWNTFFLNQCCSQKFQKTVQLLCSIVLLSNSKFWLHNLHLFKTMVCYFKTAFIDGTGHPFCPPWLPSSEPSFDLMILGMFPLFPRKKSPLKIQKMFWEIFVQKCFGVSSQIARREVEIIIPLNRCMEIESIFQR